MTPIITRGLGKHPLEKQDSSVRYINELFNNWLKKTLILSQLTPMGFDCWSIKKVKPRLVLVSLIALVGGLVIKTQLLIISFT